MKKTNKYERPIIEEFVWDMEKMDMRLGAWGPPWHNWAHSYKSEEKNNTEEYDPGKIDAN